MKFLALVAVLIVQVFCTAPPPEFVKSTKGWLKADAAMKAGRVQAVPSASKFPSALAQQPLVNDLISSISQDSIQGFVNKLTQFPERHYQSQNGVDSAKWLFDQATALQSVISPDTVLTVRFFNHTQWKQPSVIVRLEPKKLPAASDIVIIGAHFDTLTYVKGTRRLYKGGAGNNPGADDCASGASIVYETLRVLATKKFIPYRPLEFHWYAAEEVGLKGSDAIAKDYSTRKVSVFTYLNLDQSGYLPAGVTESIGVMTDYVSDAATAFLKLTLEAYTTVPKKNIVNTACGYACTDHASWHAYGFNAALAAESTFEKSFTYNDQVNADGSFLDTVSVLNYGHITQFIRNSIGYLVELSLTGSQ
ncbi:hypothetical protein BC833DRAFT_577358 [Globomyces pollinis-pini]|nr:hypothetical protein BC833DRAFT_577358 [Globomyces pollinis-pini]